MLKSMLSVGAFLLSTAVMAAESDLMIAFSTPGPDAYADGATVLDGECYALVWTAAGGTFGGIAADGSAAGSSSRVLAIAPAAKGGACPKIYFEVESDLADELAGGTYGVCLLDTRVGGESAGLDAAGKPKVVNGWGMVAGAAVTAVRSGAAVFAAATGSASPAVAATGAAAPAGVAQPKVKDFKVIGGNAYITVENLGGYLSVKGGDTPAADGAIGSAERAPDSGDAVLIRPAKGSHGFFSVIRN